MDNVEERLNKVIAEQLGIEEADVITTANFETDLSADDLDITEIVISAERVFGITLDGDQVENVKTVNDLLVLVREKSPK
ncbi:acyl carrier protein [Pseudomonas sp. BW13M1]|uniref:Acyl carrier protein n=1 Tax=Pseudomonas peradeniyensis TaxID=2745488 RepID=A0A923G7Z2_9PSED|nr:acyl carrier protein [Pseudomonas peradeniyensis]MBV4503900.1 acyl carrier protein [Pseudomonas peradeniyensis]